MTESNTKREMSNLLVLVLSLIIIWFLLQLTPWRPNEWVGLFMGVWSGLGIVFLNRVTDSFKSIKVNPDNLIKQYLRAIVLTIA